MTASVLPFSGLSPAAYDNVEALGAAALSQGRACLPLLQAEVMGALAPRDRFSARRVIALIEQRRLLEERSVTDIGVLLDLLAQQVAAGTVEITRWSDEFEGQVTEARSWTERHRTPAAQRLVEAVEELERLRTLVHAVLDLTEAQAAIYRLANRQR